MSDDAAPLTVRTIEKMVRHRPGQEHYPLLDTVIQGFALGLWAALRELAGEQAEVSHKATALASFGPYREGLAPGSLLAVFRFEEWDGEGLVVLDGPLLDAAIETFLGGGRVGNRPAAPRPHTPTDRAVAGRMVRLIVGQLTQAFVAADQGIAPLTARFVRTESRPQLVAIAREDETAAVATFEAILGADDRRGGFEIVLPYGTLEPARPFLMQSHPAERRRPVRSGPGVALARMPETTVTLHAVVDRIRISLAELASWQVGTCVRLDADREQPIAIYCEQAQGRGPGRRLFTGQLGAARGRRAIRIAEVIDGAVNRQEGESQ